MPAINLSVLEDRNKFGPPYCRHEGLEVEYGGKYVDVLYGRPPIKKSPNVFESPKLGKKSKFRGLLKIYELYSFLDH